MLLLEQLKQSRRLPKRKFSTKSNQEAQDQHNKTKKLVTLTAVRPPARFGALKIKNENVINFREKSKLDEGWINGGYFIIEPRFLDYIKNDKSFLEREPLELITKKRLLGAYKHKGFWQCVDTKRDKDLLEEYLKKNK